MNKLNSTALQYLETKNVDIETATEAQVSDAVAYSTCYAWYIEKQKVLENTAKIASSVFIEKYALRDINGICTELTPEDMWKRLSKTLASVEMKTNKNNTKTEQEWEQLFYDTFSDFKYVLGGSGLSAVGNTVSRMSASNCYVIRPPQDSMDEIFRACKDMANIQKYRGGTGVDISNLRPHGAEVSNAAKESSGAVSFMDLLSKVTATVGQRGRSGATMISIRSSHPDIERFIEEKQDLDKQDFFNELAQVGINIEDWKYTPITARLKSTTKANISVRVDDVFMTAVKNDSEYNLWFNFPKTSKYINISKKVRAKNIWNKLVAANVKAAEPGLLFWDTIIRQSIPDCYGSGEAFVDGVNQSYDFTTLGVNPCAELSLNNDACSIGSLFLCQFVENPFTNLASFNFKKFEEVSRLAIRIQDNVREYDMDYLPLPEYKISAVLGRRIGIGFHGLADTLAALGFKYDTEEAINMSYNISKVLKNTIYDESVTLGLEKGIFPIWNWEKEKNNPYIASLSPEVIEKIKLHGRRNIACQTIAPTGSISILSRNCSSGIEPIFKLNYNRAIKKQGSEETVLHTVNHQALQDCLDVDGDSSVFVEANDINWKLRIKMQAACQKNIDHSISSTVNLPKGTTEETVSELYFAAWEAGLKGITTYVEGSRTGVLTSIDQSPSKTHKVVERPKTTDVDIFKTRYKDRNYMILVGKTEGNPIEIFGGEETGVSLPTKYKSATLTKKSRGHYTLNIQLSEDEEDVLKVNSISNLFPAGDVITIARMISMSLRNGIAVSEIVEQLAKSGSSLYDLPTVFARVLKNYIPDVELIAKEKAKNKPCPECGSELNYKRESGCLTEICSSCNYSNSKCG